MIYPKMGKTITQTLMGRHLRDTLPGITDFYQLKKEFVMEKNYLLAAKLNIKMKMYYNRGSKVLPKLAVGDKVRIQNQTTVRTTMWDRTGLIMRVLKASSTRSWWMGAGDSQSKTG